MPKKQNNLLAFAPKVIRREKKVYEQAARAILYALDCKDHYTYGHSMRVAYYALCLGRAIGLSDEQLYELELASLFHDIGKIGIPDAILLKPQRLEEEEFQIMKKHPEISGEILRQLDGFKQVALYARHHHERYDGRGYPDGLKGDEIPLCSQIILIADTFDAMTSTRPYREKLSQEMAFEELLEFSGGQFNPRLTEVFIDCMKKEIKNNSEEFYLKVMQKSFKKEAA